jgi:DNA-binding NarL/FixJ family response regulator
LSVAKTTVKTHGARILTKLNLRDAGVLTYEGTVALREGGSPRGQGRPTFQRTRARSANASATRVVAGPSTPSS